MCDLEPFSKIRSHIMIIIYSCYDIVCVVISQLASGLEDDPVILVLSHAMPR